MSDAATPPVRKRSAIVAGVLTFLAGPVGFLYVGRWRWALGYCITLALLVALSGWTKLVFTLAGFGLYIVLLLTFWLAGVAFAVRLALRAQTAPLRRYQRWYAYVGFYLVFAVAFEALLASRGTIFGYEPFRVPSRSMMDTLLPGDHFISDTWAFRTRTPERGEIVVFIFPRDRSLKYVQRVIGLPGDTVQLRDGDVVVNGARLDEPYVNPQLRKDRSLGNREFKLPAGEFFVLGDNRDNSSDSRIWGTVPRANLYGTVEYLWFSVGDEGVRFDRIGKVVR